MLLIAQNYAMAYALVGLGVCLGLLAICIPRPRKRFTVDNKKTSLRRTPRKT